MPDMEHMNHAHPRPERPSVPRLPAILCKVTGTVGIDEAYAMLTNNSSPLDAAVHICTTQENNPDDHSAGLGGFPTSAGIVELDACCFDGLSGGAAAVRSVQGIRNVASLARVVSQTRRGTTLHGNAAQAFALRHGFSQEDLLTAYNAQCYRLWRMLRTDKPLPASLRANPDLLSRLRKPYFFPHSEDELHALIHQIEPLAVSTGMTPSSSWRGAFDCLVPTAEPIFAACIGRAGDLSCAITSSGQPWRHPGAYSDAAVLGAGCIVDNAVGAAGASGNADDNIRIAGAHRIIQNMRSGMSPEAAGLETLRRIATMHISDQLRLRRLELIYYVLRKDGAYAGVSLWAFGKDGRRKQYVIKDELASRRTEDCTALFQGNPTTFHF